MKTDLVDVIEVISVKYFIDHFLYGKEFRKYIFLNQKNIVEFFFSLNKVQAERRGIRNI